MNQDRTFVDRLLDSLLGRRQRQRPQGAPLESHELLRLAEVSGQREECTEEQRNYHVAAEFGMEEQWRTLIWPKLQGMDFSVAVDLAAGYGRNSVKLLEHADELIVVDINRECIEYCRRRFAGDERVRYLWADGVSLKGIADASVTLVYSFDAMVHFDSDVVRAYLEEIERVLQVGGGCFCHHSNYTGQPGGGTVDTMHNRNFMSAAFFAHYSIKAGLAVREQEILDWGGCAELDCISILEKPSPRM